MLEHKETPLQPLLDDESTDADIPMVDPQQLTLSQSGQKRQRRWFVVLAILIIVVLVGSGIFYWQLTKTPAVQFTQATVTTGNLSVKISATGPITANALYNMNFLAPGQVHDIDVQVGQHVKQGQVLAKLTVDTTALQDTVTQAQIGMNTAQSELASAQSGVGSAQANDSRVQAANATALTTAQDQEQTDLSSCNNPHAVPNCQQAAQDKFAQAQSQANASSASALNQITMAQGQVVTAQGNLDKAQAQLQAAQHSLNNANSNANLVAPTNVTVASINGVVGQNIGNNGNSGSATSGASTSAATPFMLLTDTSSLGVAAEVNEADIGNVQIGQSAQFTVSAYPDNTFRASVAAIDTIGQVTSNVVSYTVRLTVDPTSINNLHLYPGMTATVNVTTAQHSGVLLIPSAALSFPTIAIQAGEVNRSAVVSLFGKGHRGQKQGIGQNRSRVVLSLHNGKLTPKVVTTGLSSGQFTEVLSGLNEGDQVVIGQTGDNLLPANSTQSGGGSKSGGSNGAPIRIGGGKGK